MMMLRHCHHLDPGSKEKRLFSLLPLVNTNQIKQDGAGLYSLIFARCFDRSEASNGRQQAGQASVDVSRGEAVEFKLAAAFWNPGPNCERLFK
jgi:hypothetical protein